jgi:hypothetical protein
MTLWIILLLVGFLGVASISGVAIYNRKRQNVAPMIHVEDDDTSSSTD